ncbi:tRNA (adenosine(37)-N6)-threonylcarbamoyltransferase complex ATPase subunit type 1 TsaE [Kaistia dalseonensis]|uniref:tRNA threonylcarbamoyladenosine biosynthesis protein TsaE n=1 Tax=Kaistia dalseonensis TaxID=410840 RepID=A0ABU0H5B6_9HYPH|nr:tRNA (adenosine(37)-N6)-threonylcarbamoyltransferase complex ATPase subunit type 1 TsaE [Kaistia dalseonensis]MCX5494929.1 tRNA (adenosine(37)-N6)-threonylcarbamoyltransferase complex ATPase subunit type 1 TsaE [Kaistia dalseonensis]MDQ0437510.1 tRNA threonylcarbamoyl adenosine modification protein YjeE [Kaistia dalseonensis]
MSEMAMRMVLPDEAATVRLAEDIAIKLRVGDVVALHGDLGAGKTTFARALIRAVAGDPALEVPSPTFTIVQTYAARLPIAHFDLYRLGSADELEEIGFDEAVSESVVLVEWPERAEGRLPADRLDIVLDLYEDGRVASLSGGGDWAKRLDRTEALRRFLDRVGWLDSERRHLQGDASSRTYERIRAPDGPSAILMDAPEQNPGWVVRDGRSYDAVAHRATSIRPFVAVGEALRAIGLAAPAILAADLPAGMLLLEDLGSVGLLDDGAPIFERYALATEVLAHIHAAPRPDRLPLPDGDIHRVPPFDRDAVAVEVELMPRWYAPLVDRPLPPEAEAAFDHVWTELFSVFDSAEKSWLLRDFHSPNLLWLEGRNGLQRMGILDYQDAMIGPSAYDVASLGQDVRVDIDPGFESALKAHYVATRLANGPFDAVGFAGAYAISGAQRATKIMGGFARLASSAGKPQYLRHIPRIKGYLRRCLEHPVLSELRLWYEKYLPLED